ncbi:MAG: c-type cytochrome [Gemmatimonadales bacterium]|nr:c-type cytochrome [Gemmatimonadales bacterium]
MRFRLTLLLACSAASGLAAQAAGKFPPDSLVNVKVIPRGTPLTQVIGTMRNYTSALGARCQYCHVGREGLPLEEFDFASDEKRTKLVARQMMQMVQEINRRLDTMPTSDSAGLQVTCGTCHRGLNRPVPLSALMEQVASASGADSAVRAYKALRERYYGGDTYNFKEPSLNIAAFRLGRASRFAEAFALLDLNETLFPRSSGMYVFRGNIKLMQGDTLAAAKAYREAVRLDPANEEAKGRLRNIGQQP